MICVADLMVITSSCSSVSALIKLGWFCHIEVEALVCWKALVKMKNTYINYWLSLAFFNGFPLNINKKYMHIHVYIQKKRYPNI